MGGKHAVQQQAQAIVKADIDTGHALVAGLKDHPVVLMAGMLSEVADQPPMVAINLATIATGLVLGDRRLTRTGVRMLAAHGVATAVKGLIKRNVDRARPALFSDREDHSPTPGDDNDGPRNSFPSGHTAGALSVARAVAREYPGAAAPVYAASAGIAIIQVPRGTHFPIDVLAGAIIGLASEWLVARVMPDAEPVRHARLVDTAAVRALTPPSAVAPPPM